MELTRLVALVCRLLRTGCRLLPWWFGQENTRTHPGQVPRSRRYQGIFCTLTQCIAWCFVCSVALPLTFRSAYALTAQANYWDVALRTYSAHKLTIKDILAGVCPASSCLLPGSPLAYTRLGFPTNRQRHSSPRRSLVPVRVLATLFYAAHRTARSVRPWRAKAPSRTPARAGTSMKPGASR